MSLSFRFSSSIHSSSFLPTNASEGVACALATSETFSIFKHLLSPSPIQLFILQSSTTTLRAGSHLLYFCSHIRYTQTSFTSRSCSTRCRCTDRYTELYAKIHSSRERKVVTRLLRTCKSIQSLICIQGGFNKLLLLRSLRKFYKLSFFSQTCFCWSTRADIRQGIVTPLMGR